MATDLQAAGAELRAYALGFPGAHEDFPWEERVIKVNKKIFIFLGLAEDPEKKLYIGVKLPQTAEFAVNLPYVQRMAYNLGKYGWISARFNPGDEAPLDMLREWIDESYRAVATKKLIAELEAKSDA